MAAPIGSGLEEVAEERKRLYSLFSRLRQSRRHIGGAETEVVVMSCLKVAVTLEKPSQSVWEEDLNRLSVRNLGKDYCSSGQEGALAS